MCQEYAHQTSHALVVNRVNDLYVFEDLSIHQITRRPKAQRDAQGRFLPNGRTAKAELNRAIFTAVWGQLVAFTRYKALRRGKLVITVPPAYSSQECAECTFTSPDNRLSQAAFVCQPCGHTDNADHNAAVVIKKRGIQKLLSGEPLTKPHQRTRIFRSLGPERSEVTPGETRLKRDPSKTGTQRSPNQELLGVITETPTATRQG
ncbi:transposase [Sulfobacillus acidophilus TPY]|nr:transposase [Sulfobacillus acidophilus TPY]